MRIDSTKDFEVYKKACSLDMHIFEISRTFPREERYSLTDQIRRSSRSVAEKSAERDLTAKFAKCRPAASRIFLL